jgi:hypothetical protein
MREDLKSDADATTVINNMIKEIVDRKEKLKGTGANDNDIQAQLDYIHSKAGN